MMQKNVVIAGYLRSPFTFAHKGEMVKLRPDEMAAQVVRALVERTGIDTSEVEDLIVGCAFPEGEQGLNVARLIGFLAELPISVAGTTVNRFCGSSMQAIHMAAGAIQLDAGEAFICAGIESMSRVPMAGFNPLLHPGLAERFPAAYISMGETAENVARRHQITRKRQEELAVESHRKAAVARGEGRLKDEIAPVIVNGKTVDADGCIRADTSLEALAELKPAFATDGSVTAATSSPLTDGASAVLVTSEDYAKAHGLKPLARIKAIAVAGCEPDVMGMGP
ncbi:MAG TPA: thiolase family protein, partial [Kiloniellaceae bacterium]|nr:thiolase family protein [Kiloniellaceae bacterium]